MALTAAITGLAGGWKGTKTVWPGPDANVIRSDLWLDARLAARGKFLVLSYDWTVSGIAQQGELGFSLSDDLMNAQGWWIDSWHNDNAVMHLSGKATEEAGLLLSGTFPAPDGPDWGWDIQIDAKTTEMDIVMWVRPPGEQGMLGVRFELIKTT
ncbi:MAG: DUF1579 family protein [Armatimonadaceae bacterium]